MVSTINYIQVTFSLRYSKFSNFKDNLWISFKNNLLNDPKRLLKAYNYAVLNADLCLNNDTC